MEQEEFGQATVAFNHMTSFGDYTNFDCSLQDETIDELVRAFRRFLLACGYGPELVDDTLGEDNY
jgi:hypothetical protein